MFVSGGLKLARSLSLSPFPRVLKLAPRSVSMSVPDDVIYKRDWLVVEASKANEAVRFYETTLGAQEVPRNYFNHPYPTSENKPPLIIVAELKICGVSFFVAYPATVDGGVKELECQVMIADVEGLKGLIANMVKGGAVEDGKEVDCFGVQLWRVKDPYNYVWKFCSVQDYPPLVQQEVVDLRRYLSKK